MDQDYNNEEQREQDWRRKLMEKQRAGSAGLFEQPAAGQNLFGSTPTPAPKQNLFDDDAAPRPAAPVQPAAQPEAAPSGQRYTAPAQQQRGPVTDTPHTAPQPTRRAAMFDQDARPQRPAQPVTDAPQAAPAPTPREQARANVEARQQAAQAQQAQRAAQGKSPAAAPSEPSAPSKPAAARPQSPDATRVMPVQNTPAAGVQQRPLAQQGTSPAQQATTTPQPQNNAGATRVMPRQPAQSMPATPQHMAQNANGSLFEDSTPTVDEPTRIGQAIQQAAEESMPAAGGPGKNSGGNGNGGGGRGGKGGKGGKNGKGKKGGGKSAKYVWKNIGKAAVIAACAGIMAAAILFVYIASYVVEATRDDDRVLDLESISQSEVGHIVARDANGEYTIEYHTIVGEMNSRWTNFNGISDYLKWAAIATEDKDYYSHGGVSFTRTIYAGLNSVLGLTESEFGASTITQQLVKNLTGEKTVRDADGDMTAGYLRKTREIFRAIGLNNNYSKDQILESYLNTIPLSGTIVGVGSGAYEYFYKTPAELTIAEAATIVGITNNPWWYNPYDKPENCIARRNYVLERMQIEGYITEAQMKEERAKPLGLYTGERAEDSARNTVTSYFTDALYWQVIEDLVRKGIAESEAAAHNMYYNSGWTIEATVDIDVQRTLEQAYANAYTEGSTFPDAVYVEEEVTNDDGSVSIVQVHPESAMTIMDYEGRVVGIVGGTGEKTASLTLNRAVQSPRQVGSTMKAVASYVLGLEYDLITWSTLVEDSPSQPGERGDNSWPTNYGDAITYAPMPVFQAMAQSTNTVAVRVGMMVGEEEMFEFAYETMGLTYLVNNYDENNNYVDPNDIGLSAMVLGGQAKGATTTQMAAAYAVYGNTGDYYQPRFYERVLDTDGNTVMTADDYAIKAVSDETSYIMNRLLRTVLHQSGGTANGMGTSRMDSVGKTGTTSNNNDRWFVGLTPYYVGAIWWGYDDNYEIKWSARASTNATVLTWQTVMNEIQENLEEKSFPEQPAGVVQLTYCRDSGYIAAEGCGNTGTGYYNAAYEPTTCTGVHAPAAE